MQKANKFSKLNAAAGAATKTDDDDDDDLLIGFWPESLFCV